MKPENTVDIAKKQWLMSGEPTRKCHNSAHALSGSNVCESDYRPDAHSTESVLLTAIVRPGAERYCQIALIRAITSEAGGNP